MANFKYSLRVLRKNPGFTLAAVVTLALGIGVISSVFSVVDAVLLRPLPYKDSSRLAMVEGNFARMGMMNLGASAREFIDYRDQNEVFERVAAFGNPTFSITGSDRPERVQAASVSDGLFDLLGISPISGRTFLTDEMEPGRDRVVILSFGLWQHRFGGSDEAIGKALELDGDRYTIVGVMPPLFQFPHLNMRGAAATDLWVPLAITPQELLHHGYNLRVIGRMKQSVSIQQAREGIDALGSGFIDRYPRSYRGPNGEDGGWKVTLIPLVEEITGDIRPALLLLFGAIAFVLLIACANVANLVLARAVGRRKEIALRLALGARRRQIIAQILAESTVLGVLGGVAGFLIALWLDHLLVVLSPADIPRIQEVGLDGRVLLFTITISLLTAFIFGLIPALHVSRPNLSDCLRDVDRAGGRTGNLIRRTMVVLEVSLALVLLIGAGLMIKSFVRLQRSDTGLNPDHVITMNIALPSPKYDDRAQQSAFFLRLLGRVETSPGVVAAAITTTPVRDPFSIEGRPFGVNNPTVAFHRVISPGYFRTIGVKTLLGREITDADGAETPTVAVINQSLAKAFFPGEDPMGKQIKVGAPQTSSPWRRIVGVTADFCDRGLGIAPEPEMFMAHAQVPAPAVTLVARSVSDPHDLAPVVSKEVSNLDQQQPITGIRTMDEVLGSSTTRPRFNTLLLGIFSLVALALAAVGVYGVIAYLATLQTREIGIRIAMGARPIHIFNKICGQAIGLVLVGIFAGLLAAIGLTRLMSGLLYGVTATDPSVFVIVTLVLFVVAVMACIIPAQRATRLDPLSALRHE